MSDKEYMHLMSRLNSYVMDSVKSSFTDNDYKCNLLRGSVSAGNVVTLAYESSAILADGHYPMTEEEAEHLRQDLKNCVFEQDTAFAEPALMIAGRVESMMNDKKEYGNPEQELF